jgi:hypothetical protein
VGFQQLYYTSCEHGLLGYGGFQFSAVTPGVGLATMREVEDATSYQPPRGMRADPGPGELADYPVAFSHWPGDAGTSITARVVFTGTDYSGRPGNYFAHALVAGSAADFGPVLPAELWAAPLWRTRPSGQRDLPELAGPLPPGYLSRDRVARFAGGQDAAVLPALLTAASTAMAGGRRVLLAGASSVVNATWIAAVSYLLGEQLARRLSFTTYSHRPAESRCHVTGVLPGSTALAAARGVDVCAPEAGQLPPGPAHPLASLLARAGVAAAGSLWRHAADLAGDATGGEATGGDAGAGDLDGWYPAVAAAAVLGEVALEPADVAAVAGWLCDADPAASRARPVLERLVRAVRPEELPGSRVAGLRALAARLGSGPAVERLTAVAVSRAHARLDAEEPAIAARPGTGHPGASPPGAAQPPGTERAGTQQPTETQPTETQPAGTQQPAEAQDGADRAGGRAVLSAALREAAVKVPRGDLRALGVLYRAYEEAGPQAQRRLVEEIPRLLSQAERLADALRGCPDPVRAAFCRELRQRQLNPLHHELAPAAPVLGRLHLPRTQLALAARVFTAILDLGERGDQAAAAELGAALGRVRGWRSSWLRALRRELGDNARALDGWLARERDGSGSGSPGGPRGQGHPSGTA